MDKLTKVHHSLTDWDFMPGRGLGIQTDQYVSAPSSLKLQKVNVPGKESCWVFLKASVAQKVEIGRFITYHRTTHAVWKDWNIYFWTKALPTNLKPRNSYFVQFLPADIALYERKAQVNDLLKHVNRDYEWNLDTWYRYRVTWFTYITVDLSFALKVIVDIEQAGDWVEKMNFDILDPLFQANVTKLVGFYYRGSDTSPTWIDDTEIWGPA